MCVTHLWVLWSPFTVAKVWGIRTALELYNAKLTHWNDTKIHRASDVQVTFMLTRDTVVVVRSEDDRLDGSDETMATAAGIDFAFARQAVLLRGVNEQHVHIAHVNWVKHAGWTLWKNSWAVMILKGVSELVYVHQLIQYDGWIKNSRDGREGSGYESGHVFMKCFRFTFKQLRVKNEANMLYVAESRSPPQIVDADTDANFDAL
jgi:hypothetical protein